MPTISIILPVYNAEKYINKCLDSLINQTFKDIEIICINDGSKDNSLSILEKYSKQDNRVNVISQTNSGPATSRNNGLKNSSGKYIMFCDSDDWYEPNMCEIMYQTLLNHNTDVVCCAVNVIDEEKNITRIDSLEYYKNNYSNFQTINNILISNTNVMLWNKIFKKSIIDKYNISFPDKYEGDDDCFYMQYMSVCKNIYFLKEKLYNYLRRSSSIMGLMGKKIEKSIFDRFYVAKKYYDFLEKNNILNLRKEVLINFLIQLGRYGSQRWNDEETKQAKNIYNTLFGNNKFYQYIFPQHHSYINIINIQKIFDIKRGILFKRYIIKIRNKKIFSFKHKVK